MLGKRTNDEIDYAGDSTDALKKQRDRRHEIMKKVFAAKMRERDVLGATGGLLEDCNCFLGYYKAIEKPVNDALARETAQKQEASVEQTTPHCVTVPTKKEMFTFDATTEKKPAANLTTTGVSFSFSSATPGSGLPPTPSVTSASVDADDDAIPSEPRVEVEYVSDPDWTTVHDVRKVKFYVFADGKWNPRASGSLRVEKNKSKPSNRRIVIRDVNTGKVHLNCSIAKQMPISAEVSNKHKVYIKFVSRQAEDEDGTSYMLQTLNTDHPKLFETLEEMAR